MSQVSSTIHIINMWLQNDDTNEIISVGIQSDGSYDIPKGIVFSQPATLNNGQWNIYKKSDLPHYLIKLRSLIALPVLISKTFKLVDDLPDANEYFMPMKLPEIKEINYLNKQRDLREKRAALLNSKGLLQQSVEDEDEEKRLERKQNIIADLKLLRQQMKDFNQSNRYSWLYKLMQKYRQEADEMQEEAEEDVPEVKKTTGKKAKERASVYGYMEEGGEEEQTEEDETEEEKMERLYRVTSEEVQEAMEKFNLSDYLGVVYGNKIMESHSDKPIGKVRPTSNKQPIRYDLKYKTICEAVNFDDKNT